MRSHNSKAVLTAPSFGLIELISTVKTSSLVGGGCTMSGTGFQSGPG